MKTIRTLLGSIFWGALLLPSFIHAQPAINSFTPTSGPVGTLVTITGTNLSSPASLTIGGVSALPVSNTGTSLVAMVMPGANTGIVSVGTANGTGNFTITTSQPPNGQEGGKLIGTGATGAARQGYAVAVSADGNTGIAGSYSDNNNAGAAWVYTRSGTNWVQQGNKLAGTGATGNAQQGYSVAISADGNTAIVGGQADNSNFGAVWIFIRTGSTWTQQGNKLTGTGVVGTTPRQGWSVSLSADGNTAIVGGYGDNSLLGAAWVFVRSGTTWTQQGAKLVGAGTAGSARFGWSVAISADGNTAIAGGYQDQNSTGAAWVFSRSGTTWTQQGSKLVGATTTGPALQGQSVSISATGNTAVVGGNADNNLAGAVWVYTRTGTTWAQQGNKLVGTGASADALQGSSVALSADGNMLIAGASADNNNTGAAWIFVRNGSTWLQQGNKLTGTGATGAAQFGASVALSANGSTAITGGFADNAFAGAAWVFVYKPPPAITGFTPASGPVGSLVTITGTNLDNPTTVNVGGVSALLISHTPTAVVAMVMPGAATGTVSVTNNAGTTTSEANFTIKASLAPNAQEGAHLTGPEVTSGSAAPFNVAVSADGNTAIIGGSDGNGMAAAWVYTRSNGIWIQQGDKLQGTNAIGNYNNAYTVAISADGNTAIAGSYLDNAGMGAIWVFTRSGNSWTQQGNKLIGSGAVGNAYQGCSVSLSGDGNTAVVGGLYDNNNIGATWVFTRSNGIWTQQGNKLVGSGASGSARQGSAVFICAEGNTAIIGGTLDNATDGAAWVFTRNETTWTQQGPKLVASVGSFGAGQGSAVALSADGNTAIVGASRAGRAWVYIRTSNNWNQQGDYLYDTGASGTGGLGNSVSLSADGNTAIIAGNSCLLFTRSGNTWIQTENRLVGTEGKQGGSVAISSDGNTALVGGTAENLKTGAAWVFVNAAPIITNFTPASGPAGTLVSISGNYLANASLSIGGVPALTVSNTVNRLVAMVMPGTTTGQISVTHAGDTTKNAGSFTLITTTAPNIQQGGKLKGTGAIGFAQQGCSVALSADGNTALVGGYRDSSGTDLFTENLSIGAAWVYTRNGNTWAQQGSKLVVYGDIFGPTYGYQGYSVALSADGNTALIGAPQYNNNEGAAWVFVRKDTTWTQQSDRLLGSGAVGKASQGGSVALSADGNTAIIGGAGDNSSVGAAWVFTRKGGVWTQQGNKLTALGASGATRVGSTVAISADGNTIILGAYNDNSGVGAAWVYTRTGSIWTQQSNKLVATDAIGAAGLGTGVAVNANGSTVIVGGSLDDNYTGAAWVFTRNGSTWTQQGNKIVGTGASGKAYQGSSVSLSADGNMAIIGGYNDNNTDGAAWVFARNGDTWIQKGAKLVGTDATESLYGGAKQGSAVALSADGSTAIMGGPSDYSTGAAWVFNYVPVPPPTITSFTPSGGTIGTLVTITGTNLVNSTGLQIGGKPAVIVSSSNNTIVAMVMPGAASGGISITTAGGTANGPVNFNVTTAQIPNTQQGVKLVGTGSSGAAQQAYSVAISADGNTAIVGGFADNLFAGAAWVYTRNGDTWSQQGIKLLGTGASGKAYQGFSVAISADGNTALVGGAVDSSNYGAIWVFTRTGNTWTQQGDKLVGIVSTGASNQGSSLALSADGNTAIVGAPYDYGIYGAAFVFTRKGTVWSQRTNSRLWNGGTNVGWSVAISADGKTAIIGGPFDENGIGAAWIYANIGGAWVPQGAKLVGTGAKGAAQQGYTVAISADGNTAMVGGRADSGSVGAVWVYTRNGTTWTQQGNKLVASGGKGISQQGVSVSLSADGNTAIIGGDSDSSNAGAAWMFTRTDSVWTQKGNKLVGTGAAGAAEQGRSVGISADGKTAIVGGPADNGGAGAAWLYTYTSPVYTFTGTGNWNVAANWADNKIPPAILPANAQILINPSGSGECIVNVPVTVPATATITVAPGKKLRIAGNLNISQ